MPAAYLAKFRLQLAPGTVETVDGYKVVRGCKVLETGGTARVKVEGVVRAIERDRELSQNLLSVAKLSGGIVNAHFTHDWTEGEADPLNYDIGFWDAFRVDDNGDLLADLNLCPSKYQDQIVFNAQKNPKGAMVSAIFKFHTLEKAGKFYADPFQFISADIVRKGEATTALFSATKLDAEPQTQTDENMPLKPEDITPEFTAALSKALLPDISKAVKDAMPAPVDATAVLKDATPLIEKAVKDGIAAQTPEITKAAEAAAVAKIGDARLSNRDGGNAGAETPEKEAEAAIAAQLTAGASSRGVAIARLASDKPKIYNFIREKGIV